MKATIVDGIYQIEPETDAEASAVQSLVSAFSVRLFNIEDAYSATRPQLSAPSQHMASEAG